MIHSQNKSSVLKNSFVDYQGAWTKSGWAKGSGLQFEAKVVSKRRHTIKTGNDADLPTRLVAIQCEVVGDIMRREWDEATGKELAPQITQNEKSIKGFLHNFDSKDAHAVNTVTIDAVIGFIKSLQSVGLISADILSKLHPKTRNQIEVWGDQSNFLDLEINEGDIIRVKTMGDSIVIDSMTVVNQGSAKTFSAGGSGLGQSWTSKIATSQTKDEPEPAPRTKEEDDEWN
jgi:hypothetical protein